MKVGRRTIYWIAAFVLVFMIFWFGYCRSSAGSKKQERIVPVEVEAVSTSSIEETIEVTGWIRANKVVDVTSKVQGRIESLQVTLDDGETAYVEEGLAVKKGQQLAVIDHDIYLAQVEAARADLQAREVDFADAEREKKRMVKLFEGGSATEQSRDKAATAAELAAAGLNLSKANLQLAQINLQESTIISPIDGIVTAKHIDEGNLIRTGDIIVTIAEMKTVKVIVAVAEEYGGQIAAGTPARIKVDAFGDRVFAAEVYSVYPALDEQTHTIQAEIRMDNNELLLKPGMFARVTLITERKDNVVVIPRDVVLGGRIDEPYVYVVEDGIAHKRFVKIGIKQADKYEITDGLKQDEKLVVNGMHYLADGMKVEVVRLEDIGVSKD
jgi:membrane fusion protein (multidrug efflux system)